MMAHELLRQAALILAAGHSKKANARDAAGRIVDLYAGAARASINPAAVAFSPYGAICKAASLTPEPGSRPPCGVCWPIWHGSASVAQRT
jgi:hypothetical protein